MEAEDEIIQEMAGVDLADCRRTRRAVALVDRLAKRPQGTLLSAMQSRAELAAAYRFLHNEAVTPAALLQVHAGAGVARMHGCERVLCVVDSCFISYSHRGAVAGLGPHTRGTDNGFFVHPTLAVNAQGLALGTLHWHSWAREPRAGKSTSQGRPSGDKESARWLESLRAVQAQQENLPHTRLTFVADREADFYELIAAASAGGTDFIIRAQSDRKLPGGQRIGEPPTQTQALGEVSFAMAARPGRSARQVTQRLWTGRVALSARRGRERTPGVEVNVVWAWESAPPAGEESVRWILLTNLPVDTLEQAMQLVQWYRLRWRIEMLFDALKNVCHIEEAQLRGAAALQNLCALHLIVAWRLLYVQGIARDRPDAPATTCFSPVELTVLARALPPPAAPLTTMREALLALARLGGYLARKHDKPPGLKTLARAHRDLCLLVAFHQRNAPSTCV